MSIMNDMREIGKLIGRDLDAEGYAPYGRCDTCKTMLDYEPPWHGTFDQPPSEGGFWCSECEEWI